MTLDGKTYQPRNRTQSIQAGVQMVHQELSLIHHLTVAENLFLNKPPTRCGVIQHRQLLKQAAMLLNRIGFHRSTWIVPQRHSVRVNSN